MRRFGRILLWLTLLFVTFAYGKFQGGFAAWFMFYAAFLLAGYELGTARYALRGAKSERRLSSLKVNAGQTLEVDIMIEIEGRKWPLPWLVVEDTLPTRLLLQSGSNRELHFPGYNRKLRLRYSLPNMPRGKYVLGDTRLVTGDIFGLTKKELVHKRSDEVTVYPKIIPIPYWHTINKFNLGHTNAQNRMAEDSSNVIGVRDYAQGDRLSRIHWRASARTGSLKTKEFELHVTNDMMFFLNRSEDAYRGGSNQLFELAVTTAASLIKHASSKKYSVGLTSYGRERVTIAQSRNFEQYLRIIEHLAIVQADGADEYNDAILREVNHLQRGSTIVLVTPVLDQPLVQLIGFLEYRKIKTELFYIVGGRQLNEVDLAHMGKLEMLGVHTYVVRDENELEDVVRGPVSYASNG
ncbi:uncharacterized protein (DUF58 family) [Tumebacillus sp. BK434]|uniref:DUF58 domain-containing protein n=1 Tax=Tumebacillus sp. BK434 TaxID=2512169 RepID=UPI001047DB9F|nr:DUF58 domain-containing protein [Tumebacillus sp. BK434]TCP52374.1 uncharacterized protein (DUF58 family) [Tumebacillus sp. BK434]